MVFVLENQLKFIFSRTIHNFHESIKSLFVSLENQLALFVKKLYLSFLLNNFKQTNP